MKVDYTAWSNILFIMCLTGGKGTKQRVSNLVDQLGDFGADISSLRSDVGNMLLYQEGKNYLDSDSHISADFTVDKRQKILEWVSGVKCEDHHAEVVKIRLEGTGTWLFQRQEIQGWLESEESSILWLHGKGNIYTSVVLEQRLTLVSSWIGEDSAQVGIPFHNYGGKHPHSHSRLALEL